MKKIKHIALLAIASSFIYGPLFVSADEIDTKIQQQEEKIQDIQINAEEAQALLDDLAANIATLEEEMAAVLAEKVTQEKKINELNEKIQALEWAIEKRSVQIEQQAREVQTTQHSTSLMDAILSAESFSQLVSRVVAVNSIVSANQEIVDQQISDQAELEVLQAENEATLLLLETQTKKLQEKQVELADAQLTQQVKIKELAAELETETAKKETYQKEKEEAEKQRQAELKRLEEQRKKEIAAQKAYEEQVAQEQATTNATAETNAPVTEVAINTETSNTSQATSSGWQMPVASAVITSPFGNRNDPTGISGTFHDGIDFGGGSGAPISASQGGEVVTATFSSMAGNHVIIKHPNGYYSYYLHLSSLAVSVGQQVSAGTTVGGMGTTGNSTGVHLHFSVSTGLWSGFVNPAPLLGL